MSKSIVAIGKNLTCKHCDDEKTKESFLTFLD